jgi:hypothetical protein
MNRLVLIVLLVGVVFLILSPSVALAVAPNNLPRFALHINDAGKVGVCNRRAPTQNCTSFTTQWPTLTGGYVCVVVAQASPLGVEGASFGVDYNPALHALDYVHWHQCGGGLTRTAGEP